MAHATKHKNVHPPIPESIDSTNVPDALFSYLPYDLIDEFQAFAFASDDTTISIAAVDPNNTTLRRYVKQRVELEPVWHQATEEDIETVLAAYRPEFSTEIEKLITSSLMSESENVSRLVDKVIVYSLKKNASDIHIEPHRHETSVRFRIDGILHEVATFPQTMHKSVVARFKILANLKIDEYRRPQDGRIEVESEEGTSLRLCTIPTLFGEKIALRILRDSIEQLSAENLGFTKEQEELLLKNAEKPFGMVIASGPTGSGKTTTLYALLQLLRKGDMNISTLEDPIEYALSGVNQVQINPQFDLTFASGLRALLRQDPDVIMVGEVRDGETAVMATSAAMTGHLVFTTIHTNDSASALTRLLEMGVEDFAIASTVNLVIGQRLVRRICPSCTTEAPVSEALAQKAFERPDVAAALKKSDITSESQLKKKSLSHGAGCSECFNTGYTGRVGLYEFLDMNRKMRSLVLSNAPTSEIQAVAEKEQGFRTFVEDGIEKVFSNVTTLEEILRVTKN